MAETTARDRRQGPSAWDRRVRSKAFRKELTTLLAREIEALAGAKVKDVVDARLVRRVIRERDVVHLDAALLADFVIRMEERVAQQVARRKKSLRGLLPRDVLAGIDGLINEDLVLSRHAEKLIAGLMRQEFVQGLFADIIYTSIVSFNQKVNPLFAGMTMMVLEKQIKSFVRFFMPALQKQAVEFAVGKNNRVVFMRFARAIARRLMDEPLPHLFAMVSPRQRDKAHAVIRSSFGAAGLETAVRKTALAVWDELYKRIRDKTVGELVDVPGHARWLAACGADAILPVLSAPPVARFVEREIARAARR